ncbi:MAG: penicillin acylase family protein [Actinobacteria bacterium]|nr:penicillin acylase family protein [Actinomycetota bacterium]
MVNLPRLALRALGKRLPTLDGTLHLREVGGKAEIRRDRFGIPHITAGDDADAWFAVGFCHGQDRAFQIETRLRLVRGTLAALIGPPGLPLDRLSRRIGFRRYGEEAAAALSPEHRRLADAYAGGVTAGADVGLSRKPHEFALLRARPTPYQAADALGFLALQAFALASNWDTELARLKLLQLDGPEALTALDPAYPEWQPASDRPGEAAGRAADRVAEDAARLAAALGLGGGSNNWAVAGWRTRTGRPVLANDPHLPPMLPPHWYLLHVTTPEWSLAGASFPGCPAVPAGHNGHSAWGVTAGLIDNTDLFLEEVGPDGRSVRRGDRFVRAEVRPEVIQVRGRPSETIEVVITDRGPIVGPAFEGEVGSLSLSATWLTPRPLGGMFDLGRVRRREDLRRAFAGWNSLPLNVVFANVDGTIGWQLVGEAPVRRSGFGALPLPAWDEATGWEPDPVPFEALPHLDDPAAGFVATANNLPSSSGPHLGCDFLDGYRVARISEALAARTDWDVPGSLALQMDSECLPWREVRDLVLRAAREDPALEAITALLEAWDGKVGPGSAAATVFEAFAAEMSGRVARARAPRGAEWALGKGFLSLIPLNSFLVRRVSHLVRLLRSQPAGWFLGGWEEEMRRALRAADHDLSSRYGPDHAGWAWGKVRTVTFKHPMSERKPLDRVFDLGPYPLGGDANTVGPGPVDPADLIGNPVAVASLRMAVDVGAWEQSRFVLPGGQSGNPFSRHYADQMPLWCKGDALPVAWSPEAVARATRHTLVLLPVR